MKIKVISLFVFLSLMVSLSAQVEMERARTISKTWVSRYESPPMKGVLFEVRDSSVVISTSLVRNDYATGNYRISDINYKDIHTIRTRKDNSIMLGMLIGTATGLLLGYMFGSNAVDDPPCPSGWAGLFCISRTAQEKARNAMITTTIFGFAIGTGMGAIKVKIPVLGSYDNLNINRDKLKKHSVRR